MQCASVRAVAPHVLCAHARRGWQVVFETHCGSGDSSNNEIETQKRNNISNVYMDTACCMPCKMQHQSSLPSSPMSAFFHLSFNDEDDSHSSEEELEKINSKGM